MTIVMCVQIEQAVLTLALQMLWSPSFWRYITRKGLPQTALSGTPLTCLYHLPT